MINETAPLAAVRVEPVVGRVPVCTVGGHTYYGTELEATAARLEKGDSVLFKGEHEVVDYAWFCEGPIIVLESGKKIFPALGDVFEVMPNAELCGAARRPHE